MTSLIKERFGVTSLRANHKLRYRYTYFVTGQGCFPVDMLRYDQAWPLEPNLGYTGGPMTADSHRELRSIAIASYNEPTLDRWSSFGWSVSAERFPT